MEDTQSSGGRTSFFPLRKERHPWGLQHYMQKHRGRWEPGAILTTPGLKGIPKLGEGKKKTLSFRKSQYIEFAGKISDSSVNACIHQHSRERALFGTASALRTPEIQLEENNQSLICSAMKWTLDRDWFQNCLVPPKQKKLNK